jgi:hypothetical protein
MRKKGIIKFVIFVGVIFAVWKCNRALFYNKNTHLHTDKIGKGIYEERFKPFSGGLLMTDIQSYYLTDSTNFRILLGQCDEKELFRCVVFGDTVKAVKY